jgi:Ser/Thr protein kinase RdoA (MazF antagonist)
MSQQPPISDSLLSVLRERHGANLGRDGIHTVKGGFLSRNFILFGGGERFFLKRYWFEDERAVRTIHRVKELFAGGSFPAVRPLAWASGETLTAHEDGIFALFPFAEGVASSYEKLTEGQAAGAGNLLGRMHHWGESAPLDLPLKPVSTWGAKKFLSQAALIEERIAALPEPGDFDRRALELLELQHRLVAENRLSLEDLNLPAPILTHGDYYAGNVFFDAQSRVKALFDFEKAEYVSAPRELARAVMLTCLGGDFGERDYALARAFIVAYREFNPVSREVLLDGFRAYLSRLAHSTWVLGEHYLNGNTRVDLFLDQEIERLRHTAEEVVENILE